MRYIRKLLTKRAVNWKQLEVGEWYGNPEWDDDHEQGFLLELVKRVARERESP